jgi:hypothetical protein
MKKNNMKAIKKIKLILYNVASNREFSPLLDSIWAYIMMQFSLLRQVKQLRRNSGIFKINRYPFKKHLNYILSISLAFLIISITSSKADFSNLPPNVQKELSRSPIGDNLNTSVYDFITHELLKHQEIPTSEILEIAKSEEEYLKNKDLKPYTADVVETQFSHILVALCKGMPGCLSIDLYQKDGLLIGSGEVDRQDFPSGIYDKAKNIIINPSKTLAVLEKDPFLNLGIKKIYCKKGFCYYLITWAIYREFAGELSFERPTKQTGQLIGFLRVIKKIKYPN